MTIVARSARTAAGTDHETRHHGAPGWLGAGTEPAGPCTPVGEEAALWVICASLSQSLGPDAGAALVLPGRQPLTKVRNMEAVQIGQVRSFSRTVTERVGALQDEFLARDRPLGQARLLWEIGPDGCDVRLLRSRLDLDSGYLI